MGDLSYIQTSKQSSLGTMTDCCIHPGINNKQGIDVRRLKCTRAASYRERFEINEKHKVKRRNEGERIMQCQWVREGRYVRWRAHELESSMEEELEESRARLLQRMGLHWSARGIL